MPGAASPAGQNGHDGSNAAASESKLNLKRDTQKAAAAGNGEHARSNACSINRRHASAKRGRTCLRSIGRNRRVVRRGDSVASGRERLDACGIDDHESGTKLGHASKVGNI